MPSVSGETHQHPTHESYEFLNFLGQGSDGKVWKARYRGTAPLGTLQPGQAVAIKLVPTPKIHLNEVLLQAMLQHLNIITLYDIFPTESGLAMVLELADHQKNKTAGPSLWDCIKGCIEKNQAVKVYQTAEPVVNGRPQFRLPLCGGEPMVRWVFLQIASALDFLHRHPKNLCNRDVKPANVLVVGFASHADGIHRPVVKLADFGFCRATDVEPAQSRLGTPAYAPPEIIKQRGTTPEGYSGPKADVWSAGVLLYVLATGIEPFKQKADLRLATQQAVNSAVMARIASGQHDHLFSHDLVGHCSPQLRDLLRRMLSPDPNSRPSMLQVIYHDWSKKLNTDIQCQPGPEGAGTYLKCWDILVENINYSVAAAHAARPGLDGASTRPTGWTLPYDPAHVEELLMECVRRKP